MNDFTMNGQCTCAAIRYRLTSRPLIVHACHCRWCQRETGTSFAQNALMEADRVVLSEGSPEVVWTPTNSGKGQKISRCPRCHISLRSNYAGAATSFDLFASAHWTTLTNFLRTSTSSRCPSNRGCSSLRERLLSNNTTIAKDFGQRKASLAGATCLHNARTQRSDPHCVPRRSRIGPYQSRPKTARFSCRLGLLSAPSQEDAT
jgi:hypothetical protein